jgi:acetylornithine/succinyldiaminopimelate/putrescine aminotransferase
MTSLVEGRGCKHVSFTWQPMKRGSSLVRSKVNEMEYNDREDIRRLVEKHF